MDKNTYKLASFNCKNIKRSFHDVRKLCSESDIIALQETWLSAEELAYLHSISDDFGCTGTSSMDTSAGILRGRPYGGLTILWRKSAFNNVSVIQCNSERVCAIKIVLNERSVLVFNVYMPTDVPSNLVEFTDCLSLVSAIIDDSNIENCYILGDFNAHPHERFFTELTGFCDELEWTCVDTELLGINSDTYTFVSDAHGSRRWLDHCLVTKAARSTVLSASVLYDTLWSDHFPLVLECLFNHVCVKKCIFNLDENNVIWGGRQKS